MGEKVVDNDAPWNPLCGTHRAWTTHYELPTLTTTTTATIFLTNQEQIFWGGDSMRV